MTTTFSPSTTFSRRTTKPVMTLGLTLILSVAALFSSALFSSPADASAQGVQVCPATVLNSACYDEVAPSGTTACTAPYSPFGTSCRAVNTGSSQAEAVAFSCPGGPAGTTVTPNFHTVKGVRVIESCSYQPGPVCPTGSVAIDGRCWQPVELVDSPVGPSVPVGPGVPAGPTEQGRITLSYTVDCVGEGLARVALGTPVLEGGAAVSLITVNGSAAVGADLAGGSDVNVQVTPQHPNHTVTVNGPSQAPSCRTATPTAVPTTAPATRAPAATAAPAESPTPTPTTAAPTATATASAGDPTETPSPAPTASAPTEIPTELSPVAPATQVDPGPGQAEVAVEAAADAAPVAASAPTTTTTAATTSSFGLTNVLAVIGALAIGALALYGAVALVKPKTQR